MSSNKIIVVVISLVVIVMMVIGGIYYSNYKNEMAMKEAQRIEAERLEVERRKLNMDYAKILTSITNNILNKVHEYDRDTPMLNWDRNSDIKLLLEAQQKLKESINKADKKDIELDDYANAMNKYIDDKLILVKLWNNYRGGDNFMLELSKINYESKKFYGRDLELLKLTSKIESDYKLK